MENTEQTVMRLSQDLDRDTGSLQNTTQPDEITAKEPELLPDTEKMHVDHNASYAYLNKAVSDNIIPNTKKQYKPMPHFTAVQLARYWRKVRKGEGCWKWTGNTAWANPARTIHYGVHRGIKVHRIAYFLEHGSIPDNLTIDHTCKNTLCVNPDHLKLATMREQVDRRDAEKIVAPGFTTCKWGHVRPRGRKAHCPECNKRFAAEFKARKEQAETQPLNSAANSTTARSQ